METQLTFQFFLMEYNRFTYYVDYHFQFKCLKKRILKVFEFEFKLTHQKSCLKSNICKYQTLCISQRDTKFNLKNSAQWI